MLNDCEFNNMAHRLIRAKKNVRLGRKLPGIPTNREWMREQFKFFDRRIILPLIARGSRMLEKKIVFIGEHSIHWPQIEQESTMSWVKLKLNEWNTCFVSRAHLIERLRASLSFQSNLSLYRQIRPSSSAPAAGELSENNSEFNYSNFISFSLSPSSAQKNFKSIFCVVLWMLDDCHFLLAEFWLVVSKTYTQLWLDLEPTVMMMMVCSNSQVISQNLRTELRESVKKHEKYFGKFVNSSAYFIFYSKSAEQLNKAVGGAGVDKAMNVNSLWANKLAAEHTHTHKMWELQPAKKKDFHQQLLFYNVQKNGKDCWIWQPKNGSVSMINESMCILISPLWLIRISDGFSSVPSSLWSEKPPKKPKNRAPIVRVFDPAMIAACYSLARSFYRLQSHMVLAAVNYYHLRRKSKICVTLSAMSKVLNS